MYQSFQERKALKEKKTLQIASFWFCRERFHCRFAQWMQDVNRVFTNSLQCKKANITNFVFHLAFGSNSSNNLERQSWYPNLTLTSISTLRKVQKIRVILGKSENTFRLLQLLSMRNRYFWACGKIEAICLQNNITEIYFIMDGSKLHFCFYSISRDGSDIDRFPNRK